MKKLLSLGMAFACTVMLCACSPVGTSTEQPDEQAQLAEQQQLLDSITFEEADEKNELLNVFKRHEKMSYTAASYDASGTQLSTVSGWFILDGNELAYNTESQPDGTVVNAAQGAASLGDPEGGYSMMIFPMDTYHENLYHMLYTDYTWTKESAVIENGELVMKGSTKAPYEEGSEEMNTINGTYYLDPVTLMFKKQTFDIYDNDMNLLFKQEYVFAYDTDAAISTAAKDAIFNEANGVCEITVIDHPEDEFPVSRTYRAAKGSKVKVVDNVGLRTAYTDEGCTIKLEGDINTNGDSVTVYICD